YSFTASGRAALPLFRAMRRLRLPAHRLRTSTGLEMAAGKRNTPADWRFERAADAPIHSFAGRIRISQSHHGACARWRGRILPPRIEQAARYRTLSNRLK